MLKSTTLSKKRSSNLLRFEDSLSRMCQKIIVANLEKFPPEVFQHLGEPLWDEIVQLAYHQTAPKEGKRQIPAIKPSILRRIESESPNLARSSVADTLVWKDCVEFSFKSGGLTRPKALQVPWPDLIDMIEQSGRKLLEYGFDAEEVAFLSETPMTIKLLQDTGIGRTVKRVMKQEANATHKEKLGNLLMKWKNEASRQGADIRVQDDVSQESAEHDIEDLQALELCSGWRTLYTILREREERRKSEQGKRMREMRENLSKVRPKVGKVRVVSTQESRMLGHPLETGNRARVIAAPVSKKLMKVRREATVSASRRPTVVSNKPQKPKSFSAAVAFASGATNSNGKKRKAPGVNIGNGKVLHVPKKMQERHKFSLK